MRFRWNGGLDFLLIIKQAWIKCVMSLLTMKIITLWGFQRIDWVCLGKALIAKLHDNRKGDSFCWSPLLFFQILNWCSSFLFEYWFIVDDWNFVINYMRFSNMHIESIDALEFSELAFWTCEDFKSHTFPITPLSVSMSR